MEESATNVSWTKKWMMIAAASGAALSFLMPKDGFQTSNAFYFWLFIILLLSVWRARHQKQAKLTDGFGIEIAVGLVIGIFIGGLGVTFGLAIKAIFF